MKILINKCRLQIRVVVLLVTFFVTAKLCMHRVVSAENFALEVETVWLYIGKCQMYSAN